MVLFTSLLYFVILCIYTCDSYGFSFFTRSMTHKKQFQCHCSKSVDSEHSFNELYDKRKIGTLAIVGAGPGDPELLTIQAMRYLNNATTVIADRLISSEILELIKCELKIANKVPGCADEAQDQIFKWIDESMQRGENIVRLKIGDPFLFGRGGEEVLEFRKKYGIDPIVVPGLSSSYVAPLVANIPLTHRDVANQVLISTGYGKVESEVIELPHYERKRTLVLLMAIGRLHNIVNTLMSEKDFPNSTPVAIVEKATTPLQRCTFGTLSNIVDKAKENEVKPPAVIIIGNVIDTLTLII